jgi:N-alpha-acetyl-L-2,4-diaminobutyrate deacetylase
LKAAQQIEPSRVRGRIIILPCLNIPAVQAGTRTSPIDKINLNRTFPGRPDGTVTEKIADFVQRYLLPEADYVLDIHSGGRTLDFLPGAACHRLANKSQEEKSIAAMKAFRAPFNFLMKEIDSVGMLDTAAEEMGKIFVSTEMGGNGTLTATTLAIAERGTRNFLVHAGILTEKIEGEEGQFLDMPDDDCFIFADVRGLIEPCFDLGQPVRKGELVMRIHDFERTGKVPAEYHAQRDGILSGRHSPGRVQPGDCLAIIASFASEP